MEPNVLVPVIVRLSLDALDEKDVTEVSQTDYQIYLTREGELYDKSVLENLKSEAATSQKAATTNVKRENKAYSYKEQMEDIALRKELEEKKRREGKLVEPKLTQKQKEVLEAHLEKEAATRKRLKEAKEKVTPPLALLSAAVAECPKAFVVAVGGSPKPFLPPLFRGMQSPLVADSLIAIFRNLRHAAFDCIDGGDDESLSQIVAALTLQVVEPASKDFVVDNPSAVSYTHLTLPTNREV